MKKALIFILITSAIAFVFYHSPGDPDRVVNANSSESTENELLNTPNPFNDYHSLLAIKHEIGPEVLESLLKDYGCFGYFSCLMSEKNYKEHENKEELIKKLSEKYNIPKKTIASIAIEMRLMESIDSIDCENA